MEWALKKALAELQGEGYYKDPYVLLEMKHAVEKTLANIHTPESQD